jgi:CDP-diacylglycerol---serine O-phosphatidyltransferase
VYIPDIMLQRLVKHVPNLLTSCNLLCGCFGIVTALEGHLIIAAGWIWLGAIFDFSDGFAARLLKAYSDIGKELDSLADVVTFGVLPSTILFMLIRESNDTENLAYVAFTLAVFSALRLAIFNIDTRQSVDFIGLPTPANAIFVSGLPFILIPRPDLMAQTWLLIALVFIMSALLVSNLSLFSLKMKDLSFKKNWYKYLLFLIAIVGLIIWKASALPGIIIAYVVLSVVFHPKK